MISSQIPFSQQMQSTVHGIASIIDKAPTQPTTIQMIETRSQTLYPNECMNYKLVDQLNKIITKNRIRNIILGCILFGIGPILLIVGLSKKSQYTTTNCTLTGYNITYPKPNVFNLYLLCDINNVYKCTPFVNYFTSLENAILYYHNNYYINQSIYVYMYNNICSYTIPDTITMIIIAGIILTGSIYSSVLVCIVRY